MAKRKRVLPGRKLRARSLDEESLLMRSAESVGRMIGTLHRQLDGATRRLSETADDLMDRIPDFAQNARGTSRSATNTKTKATKKAAARKRTTSRSASSARAGGASRAGAASRSAKKR